MSEPYGVRECRGHWHVVNTVADEDVSVAMNEDDARDLAAHYNDGELTPRTLAPAAPPVTETSESDFMLVRACREIAKRHNNPDCACEFCCYLVNTGYWYDGWGKRPTPLPPIRRSPTDAR